MKLQVSTFVALLALTATLAVAQEQPNDSDTQDRPAVRRTDDTRAGEAPRRGQPRTGATRQAGQADQAEAMHSLDGFIAAGLVIDNQEEIELNRAAMEKIQNDQAKQFAQMMIEEHTKALEQLQQIVPQGVTTDLQFTSVRATDGARPDATQPRANGTERPKPGQDNQDQDEGRDQEQDQGQEQGQTDRQPQRDKAQGATRRPGAQAGQDQAELHVSAVTITRGAPMHRLLMIHRQKAEHCLAISKKQLEESQGADVDQVYLGQQVAAHVSMLAKLRALEGQTGPELQQLVTQAEKSTQQHLQQAEQLMKQIGSGGEGASPANSN